MPGLMKLKNKGGAVIATPFDYRFDYESTNFQFF